MSGSNTPGFYDVSRPADGLSVPVADVSVNLNESVFAADASLAAVPPLAPAAVVASAWGTADSSASGDPGGAGDGPLGGAKNPASDPLAAAGHALSSYFADDDSTAAADDGASFFKTLATSRSEPHDGPPKVLGSGAAESVPRDRVDSHVQGSGGGDRAIEPPFAVAPAPSISSYFDAVEGPAADAFDSIVHPASPRDLATAHCGSSVAAPQAQGTARPDSQPKEQEQFADSRSSTAATATASGSVPLPFGVTDSDRRTEAGGNDDDDDDTNPFLVVERSVEREDRAFDAWIPCAKTQRTLMQVLTAATSVGAPPDQLTAPGMVTIEAPQDGVLQLLYRLKLDADIAKRQASYVDEYSYDVDGLRTLLEAKSWLQCLELTGHLLTNAGQGLNKAGVPSRHTPETLKVWAVRLAVMVKLKMFVSAEAECQTFGDMDGPDLYYEYYPQLYHRRKGSMVPFGMRLLRAQLPLMIGNHSLALERLLQLRAVVSKILANLRAGLTEDGGVMVITEESRSASIKLWCRRELMTLYSLANCLIELKDISLAVKVYEEIASKDRDNAPAAYTSVGRLLLQVGDVGSARTYFHKAHLMEASPAKKKFSETLNRGYLALASGECSEACECFSEACLVATASNDLRSHALALNNLAVSQMYARRLAEAAPLLESGLRADPLRLVGDATLLNLFTLYDLATPSATHKKVAVLQLANERSAHAFSAAPFKML